MSRSWLYTHAHNTCKDILTLVVCPKNKWITWRDLCKIYTCKGCTAFFIKWYEDYEKDINYIKQ